MKKILLAVFVAAAALTSCNNGTPKANLKTDIDTLSYEMGLTMGPTAEELASYLKQSGSDSAYADDFIKGYLDGLKAADDKKKSKDLEHQVALLEFELEYRKKAHALAEKKRISEQRRKRGSSGKSSKARNTEGK